MIEQLKVLSLVVDKMRPNTPPELREKAIALQCCANLIDAELAKKDELEKDKAEGEPE